MSTWNPTDTVAEVGVGGASTAAAGAGDAALSITENTSLEIDMDAYEGGDPYNSTGQHLVELLRKLEQGK